MVTTTAGGIANINCFKNTNNNRIPDRTMWWRATYLISCAHVKYLCKFLKSTNVPTKKFALHKFVYLQIGWRQMCACTLCNIIQYWDDKVVQAHTPVAAFVHTQTHTNQCLEKVSLHGKILNIYPFISTHCIVKHLTICHLLPCVCTWFTWNSSLETHANTNGTRNEGSSFHLMAVSIHKTHTQCGTYMKNDETDSIKQKHSWHSVFIDILPK